MDKILVFENGKIVESGSHEELMKQNGLYSKFWYSQNKHFIET
jgi:ABC-type multidrug transport system fused ATPase/permease subunit